jgi:hypothetical protein
MLKMRIEDGSTVPAVRCRVLNVYDIITGIFTTLQIMPLAVE